MGVVAGGGLQREWLPHLVRHGQGRRRIQGSLQGMDRRTLCARWDCLLFHIHGDPKGDHISGTVTDIIVNPMLQSFGAINIWR